MKTVPLLPDDCAATVEHHGRPMVFHRSHTGWEGKPGRGHEVTEVHLRCAQCPTQVTITVRDPA